LLTPEGELLVFRTVDAGQLFLPTGRIVAADPFVLPGTKAFTRSVPPGKYAAEFIIATCEKERRFAYAVLRFRPSLPARWELALLPGQNPSNLAEGEFFGYPVDTGMGSFMDEKTAVLLRGQYDADENFWKTISRTLGDRSNDATGWTNFVLESVSGLNLVACESGWGDGLYGTFFGLDAENEPLCLLTDFGVVESLMAPPDEQPPRRKWLV
jgi:hypothetical protein